MRFATWSISSFQADSAGTNSEGRPAPTGPRAIFLPKLLGPQARFLIFVTDFVPRALD
jgi:hypothetical protein